jgi:hypothetical protein
MYGCGTEARERGQVQGRRVTLVLRKPKARILAIQSGHERIAPALGDDRGGADCRHQIVPAWQGFN